MNYECSPDIDRNQDLTVNALRLFHRFRQEADLNTLSTLLDEETARHIKLCELSILYYASCDYYWAPLPRHPIQDVNTWTFRHLEEMGFRIEHRTTGRRKEVEDEMNRDKRLSAVEVEYCSTAGWFHGSDDPRHDISAEWRRREALEDADRAKNPPTPTAEIVDGEIKSAEAAWAAILDQQYIVEVQCIHGRNFLCVFDLATKKCLRFEETEVAFGAMFGPDVGDVAQWQERAKQIVDSIRSAQDGGDAQPSQA